MLAFANIQGKNLRMKSTRNPGSLAVLHPGEMIIESEDDVVRAVDVGQDTNGVYRNEPEPMPIIAIRKSFKKMHEFKW